MDVRSDMQNAEIEVRDLLAQSLSNAVKGIVEAYLSRSSSEREAFVSVLAARLVSAEIIKRSRKNPSSATPETREFFVCSRSRRGDLDNTQTPRMIYSQNLARMTPARARGLRRRAHAAGGRGAAFSLGVLGAAGAASAARRLGLLAAAWRARLRQDAHRRRGRAAVGEDQRLRQHHRRRRRRCARRDGRGRVRPHQYLSAGRAAQIRRRAQLPGMAERRAHAAVFGRSAGAFARQAALQAMGRRTRGLALSRSLGSGGVRAAARREAASRHHDDAASDQAHSRIARQSADPCDARDDLRQSRQSAAKFYRPDFARL